MFSHQLPISFQMATLVSPIPRSTVIWFGSLEFMSTSFGYDMIVLSVKGPGGARIAPARPKAPRRPRHHASPPKKRRGQHHHCPSAATRPSAPRIRQPDVTRATRQRWTVMRLARPRPPRSCYHTGCSPLGERTHSVWTAPRHHSPGQYVQTPRHTWNDQRSSRATPERSSNQPSCRISPRCEASDA